MATAPNDLAVEFDENTGLPGLIQHVKSLLANERAVRLLEIVSFIALIGFAVATATYLTSQGPKSEPLSPAFSAFLLVANLLPAATLLTLFGRRIALSRAPLANIGSRQRMHVRLVVIFSLIATLPTMLLVIFASVLFQSGVQFWFSSSARGMLENAGSLAKGYYEEKLQDVGGETTAMASDVRYMLDQTTPDNPQFMDAYYRQVLNRKLSESAIVTISPNKIEQTTAVVTPDDKRKRPWISPVTLQRLQNGEKLVVLAAPDKVEATAILYDRPLTLIYANRAVTVPSYLLGAKAQSVLSDYEAMVSRSRKLQTNFNITLYIVALAIIGVTIWIALLVADRLVRPVTNLVEAAQQIAAGDLSARVVEDPIRMDEVAFLAQNFNLMTERLQSQTNTLVLANRQLDDRRVFTEAVLESISSGVVSISKNGDIRLANSMAQALLSHNETDIVGQQFAEVAPALAKVVDERKSHSIVQLGDGPEPQTVVVKVCIGEASTVVTFEDISQQLADQRTAAWSDVARRIAHEIKNPLTPIQLAAERLKRRFGKQIGEGDDVFAQLTDTIIRQVGDLRKIVDEFSSFARMPKPVFRLENLNDIVGQAVFLFEVGHSNINFEFVHNLPVSNVLCDRRQIGQAVTNILKNAAESVSEREESGGSKSGFTPKIHTNIENFDDRVQIEITDNGRGLPEDRGRLLEPYVTTRKKGSGLGLAIVKKIMEEHGGEIQFADGENGGAKITLVLPISDRPDASNSIEFTA